MSDFSEDDPPLRASAFSHHSDTLARLGGPIMVRRPDGNVVELPAHTQLKPGWVRVDGDDETEKQRRRELGEMNMATPTLDPTARFTGRRVWLDGEGFHPERTSDRAAFQPIVTDVDGEPTRARDVIAGQLDRSVSRPTRNL